MQVVLIMLPDLMQQCHQTFFKSIPNSLLLDLESTDLIMASLRKNRNLCQN